MVIGDGKMTKQELGELLKETARKEDEELVELKKYNKYIGLDGGVSKKYRNMRKEIFARYEREKED